VVGGAFPAELAWPLVGREPELARIAADREEGYPGVVITASAGVGKSRLGREALAVAENDGALTEWVQATDSAAMVPLGAFAALLPKGTRSEQMFTLLRAISRSLGERAAGRAIVLAVDDAQLLDPVSAALVLQLASTGDAFVIRPSGRASRAPTRSCRCGRTPVPIASSWRA
jgi:type II secretory pathway predicted ATPase ExeA